jgi:hypothetical protein
MPIAIKYLLAGLLLAGVSVVWMPRVTGFDPLAWLSSDEPKPEHVPAAIDAPIDEPLPTEEDAGAGRIEDLPVKELEQIVHFLESRDLATAPEAAGAQAIVAEPLEPDDQESEPSEAPAAPESLRTLETFLAQHPLNAILIGKGQGSALLGTRRVVEGDLLLDGTVEVRSIAVGGVVLETAQGNVHVPLPPPGGRPLETKQP